MHKITLTWPGGEHEFALSLGALRAIQTASNAGPQEILQRMMVAKWRVDDILGVIRHGLEGGGLGKTEAREMVEIVADRSGLVALVPVARSVLAAALIGVEGDPVGEPAGVTSSPESGDGASSMAPELPLASPPATSTA